MSDNHEAALLAHVPDGLFVGGRWRTAADGARFDVHDPATGQVVKEVADATVADGTAALDAACDAFPVWAATPARVRAEILRRAFDLVHERTEELTLLMTVEMGKPLAEARGEVAYGAEFLRWFSEEAVRVQGRYGANPAGTGRMVVTHHPVGPCFLITPWNFPLAMVTRKVAPALAAGCTVVIKPAALTPLTTLAMVQILHEAGVPDGVVNVVTTTRTGQVSEAIIRDPRLWRSCRSTTRTTQSGPPTTRSTGSCRTSTQRTSPGGSAWSNGWRPG
jgi:succinate-semialdehyde dehydrogenase/glutarate-semialdehyde dehydrogenase